MRSCRALTIFVIPYICAFERNDSKFSETEREDRDGQRKRMRDCARERKGIFIIVRMIRYRGIRDNDNEGDAERPREIIRLATTIIDHSESHRYGDIYILYIHISYIKSNDNKAKTSKKIREIKEIMKLSCETRRFACLPSNTKSFEKKEEKKKKKQEEKL